MESGRKGAPNRPEFRTRSMLYVRGWSMLLQVHLIGKNDLNDLIHREEVI
jgi:hypothetical protein